MAASRRRYRNAVDVIQTPPVGAGPYRRPTPAHWRGIASLARQLAEARGLRVPVQISYQTPPDPTAQAYTVSWMSDRGSVRRARVWVDPRMHRAAAIDSLLHELAHVIHDQRLGRRAGKRRDPRNDAEAHPREFWAIYGQLYNDWCRRYGA